MDNKMMTPNSRDSLDFRKGAIEEWRSVDIEADTSENYKDVVHCIYLGIEGFSVNSMHNACQPEYVYLL